LQGLKCRIKTRMPRKWNPGFQYSSIPDTISQIHHHDNKGNWRAGKCRKQWLTSRLDEIGKKGGVCLPGCHSQRHIKSKTKSVDIPVFELEGHHQWFKLIVVTHANLAHDNRTTTKEVGGFGEWRGVYVFPPTGCRRFLAAFLLAADMKSKSPYQAKLQGQT